MALTERKIVNVFAKEPEPVDVPGLVTFSLGPLPADLRPDPRQPGGLGQPPDPRLPDRRRGPYGGVRRDRAAQQAPDARPALFRKPAFNGVSAVAFALSAGMFAMFLYLTIYMQGVLDSRRSRRGCASCR